MESIDIKRLEGEIFEIGQRIFRLADEKSSSPLTKEFYQSWLLDWSMKNPHFKVQLFRFIDVLPTLSSSAEVAQIAKEYLLPVSEALPAPLRAGLSLGTSGLTSFASAPIIRSQVESIAAQFIAGEDLKSAQSNLIKLRNSGTSFIACFLGDAVVSQEESLSYLDKYKNLTAQLSELIEAGELEKRKNLGSKSPVHISVKLSTLYSQIRPLNYQRSVEVLEERFSQIALAAKQNGAFLCIDMEETSFVSITLEVFKRVLKKEEFQDWNGLGLVLQAYAKRTEEDLKDLIAFARSRTAPICVRLVKGAYWDTEYFMSEKHGWEQPLFLNKSSSDYNYEKLSKLLLDAHDCVYSAFGSHNIRSLAAAAAYAKLKGIEKDKFEMQFLYGMAQPIKDAFKDEGFLVRDYVPIGKLIPGMGYLVRRLLENTSNEGFLRLKFHEDETPEFLLEPPVYRDGDFSLPWQTNDGFQNVPLRDFSEETSRKAIFEELDSQLRAFGKKPVMVCPYIGSKKIANGEKFSIKSPNDNLTTVSKGFFAKIDTAEKALSLLENQQVSWGESNCEERISILRKVANSLDEKREEFIAALCIEAGKSVEESDGEVTEAIDFLNYYAFQAEGLFLDKPTGGMIAFPCEKNELRNIARGLTVVIGPWNFPLAIPCGMFAASLVCGNCTILKPSEQCSMVALKLYQLFLESGLPPEVTAFLPGRGEIIGRKLVNDSRVSTITFTGSKEVGLEIIKSAGLIKKGQKHVKKVVAEMGGKNSIIVDSSSDLDEAVDGVLRSAFGFQGQKCSACSKAIIVGKDTYAAFSERIKEALLSMPIGPSWDPRNYAGPVIDQEQKSRIEGIVNRARKTANVLVEHTEATKSENKGHFVNPIIFTDVKKCDSLLNEEVFGPVLVLIFAENFEEALEHANSSQYGLTGGVFSRSPENIKSAKLYFDVGNLYINRKCTGAIVGQQAFGGSKMSGIGIKAGGPFYLTQFVNQVLICENTLRRGFAPE